ncbi:MAG: single-stranded DNA-binding protein [Verrucomicrobiae bacterium]|nr:single-stranded DNA-binding protein [Verrucomicrobiae bacterium]
MASYNRVLLIGNLTRDPEVRFTPKGTAVANLGLAINRTYTAETGETKEEVVFVDIEVWGRQAELAGQYLAKGRQVFVEGRLRMDSWEDKESGQKRSRLRVVAERIQFLGAPRADAEISEQAPPTGQRATPRQRPQSPPPEPEEPPPPPEEDDDIPF